MSFEPIILGPKYAIRLEDLTPRDAIEVSCLSCSHKLLVGPHRLYERYMGYMRLIEIGKDLRCARCQRRPVTLKNFNIFVNRVAFGTKISMT